MESRHQPVMLAETLAGLNPRQGGIYLDATCDGAGHAAALLEASGPDGRLIGLDMDQAMLAFAKERLAPYGERVTLINTNFARVAEIAKLHAPQGFDGILADLGFSSNQIDDPTRGLAFSKPGPLDMRLNASEGESAAELLARLDEAELAGILDEFGEERFARKIARAIKERLLRAPFKDTADLALLIAQAIPRRFHPPNTHPATRSFQALRIAVNGELDSLDAFLPGAFASLKIGGRLAVMSYHSLEDRRVRHAMLGWEHPCTCPPRLPCVCGKTPTAQILTRKPLGAGPNECESNPRARSAKLRLAQRIA